MGNCSVSELRFYRGGASPVSNYVGWDGATRVIRIKFTTPASGASKLTFSIPVLQKPAGDYRRTILVKVNQDPDSYANALNLASDGSLSYTRTPGSYPETGTLSGSAKVVLLPNTTYYAWVFPSVKATDYYAVPTELQRYNINASVGIGLVYIDNGAGFQAYQCYIDNGSTWELYAPYIDNGSGWDLCT